MNPILKNRRNLILYLLAWIFIATVQAGFLVVYFHLDILTAITDSTVFNSLFSLIGLVVWYPIRYMPLSNKNLFYIFLNLFTLGILVILIWMSSGFFIMKAIFSFNEDLMQSLMLSIPYRIIFGMLLFVVLLMVYYLIVYARNLKEKIRNEAELKNLVKEAELNMLKSQINPHFLFNSLNSVSSLTRDNPATAREMIIKLSEFLRYSLKHTEMDRNPMKAEIENIRRYLDIEKVRFGTKLIFNIGCDTTAENWFVPNMILQPLLENAVKHGVYESTEPVTIQMDSKAENDMLVIKITNNYDKDSPGRSGAGIGLKNIRARLRLIYGRDDLLNLKKEDGSFTVTLSIPRHENKSIDN